MKYLFFIFLFVGCHNSETEKPTYVVVDKKFCLQACRATEFKNFHAMSGQFLGGSSSSSMNGLRQSAIYDRVNQECELFYKDSKCCYGDFQTGYNHLYSNHGGDGLTIYGQCKK